MIAATFSAEDAVGVLQKRGMHFRRSGGRWLAHCPIHDDSKPSLGVWRGRDGSAVISCFPCGFNDSLPRFLCRMDGREPRGQSWIEALKECGVEVATDGKLKPKFRRVWSAWEAVDRAEIPIALAAGFRDPAAQMAKFIKTEAQAGHDPAAPYVRKLVAALKYFQTHALS